MWPKRDVLQPGACIRESYLIGALTISFFCKFPFQTEHVWLWFVCFVPNSVHLTGGRTKFETQKQSNGLRKKKNRHQTGGAKWQTSRGKWKKKRGERERQGALTHGCGRVSRVTRFKTLRITCAEIIILPNVGVPRCWCTRRHFQ